MPTLTVFTAIGFAAFVTGCGGFSVSSLASKGSESGGADPTPTGDTKAEAKWAELAVNYILAVGDDGTLVKMTEGKCGKPFDSGCQVRARGGSGYQLIKDGDELTDEVIEVFETLEQWREEL